MQRASIFLVSCLLTLALAQIRIPLQRSSRPDIDVDPILKYSMVIKALQYKYGRPLLDSSPQPLAKYLDAQYLGNISIGSPVQNFTMLFVTDDLNFWVPSVSCYSSDKGCNSSRHRYDSRKSNSYKSNGQSITFRYNDTERVKGFLSQDTVTVAGLAVQDQVFAEVLQETFVDVGFDGILGLPWYVPVGGVTPVFQNMISQHLVSQSTFSFYLNRTAEAGELAGELLFGGSDPTHYTDPLKFVDLENEAYWAVHMESVSVGNCSFCTSQHGCVAIVDTGTSLLAGPSNETDMINEMLGGMKEQGVYVIPCSTIASLPNVEFTIGADLKFELTPQEYILQRKTMNGTICISGFQGLDPFEHSHLWILGDMFISVYYTEFDVGNRRIGFSRAKI